MATIFDYTRLAILEQAAEDVRSLIPDVFDRVDVKMPTRDWLDTVKITPRSKSIAYLIDVPSAQTEGKRSAFFGDACVGKYLTDYAWGIIGASPLPKDEEPQDVVVPIFEAVFAVVLGNDTRTDASGKPLALGTFPVSTNHSGREKAPRISWNMLFVSPFEWGVEK